MDNLITYKFIYVSIYNLKVTYMNFYLYHDFESIVKHIEDVIKVINLNGILNLMKIIYQCLIYAQILC
jgi:hypothetical protein